MQRHQWANELHRAIPMRSDIATIEMIARGARSAGGAYAICPRASRRDPTARVPRVCPLRQCATMHRLTARLRVRPRL